MALLAASAVTPVAAQQVACDPTPAMPENAVSSSFDAQVRQMLRENEDFTKPICEVKTPRALRVARLIKPIAAAAHDVGGSTRFLVLNKDEENAFATGWPESGYHLIVVYTGMIEALDRRAAQAAPRAGRSASELSDIFLSTVIAHEMSHNILRHSQDSNCRRSNNLNAAGAGGEAGTSRAEGTRVAAPGVVACRQYSQAKELAADSLAAFLMFAIRKSAVFSDAGDLVRLWELDAAEERASGENAFFGERVMSTHPSAVRRAALYMRQSQQSRSLRKLRALRQGGPSSARVSLTVVTPGTSSLRFCSVRRCSMPRNTPSGPMRTAKVCRPVGWRG